MQEPAPGTGVAAAVELREDLPLKAGGGGGAWCAGGPRLVLAAFAALTAAITLALLTQIYSGDYEVVPHGSVSSSAAACSRAGTDVLKAGGRSLDAAAAAALCLAVVAPHTTSLDASGSLLYWEYRQLRTQRPTLAEWGGPAVGPAGAPAGGPAGGSDRPPRLVAALAVLHAELGALPWSRLLQPAIDLARNGFTVSESLATALAAEAAAGDPAGGSADSLTSGSVGGLAGRVTPPPAGSLSTAPQLADYLELLQHNTSAELASSWGGGWLSRGAAPAAVAGSTRAFVGGARAGLVLRALTAALQPPPAGLDDAQTRAVAALVGGPAEGAAGGAAGGVATGLAVIDRLDTYAALVTGLSVAFGSGPATAAGWTRDEPTSPLDLAPAILVQKQVCGTRFVVGAESSAALAQAGAALGAGGGAAAVERPRAALRPGSPPAVNLVQQTGDRLLSHADSRGGGLASRF